MIFFLLRDSENYLLKEYASVKELEIRKLRESLGMRLSSPPIRKALWSIVRHSERSTCEAPAIGHFFRFRLTQFPLFSILLRSS